MRATSQNNYKQTTKNIFLKERPSFKISTLKKSPVKPRESIAVESNSSQLNIPVDKKRRRVSIRVPVPNLPPQDTLQSWYLSSKNMSSNNVNNSDLHFPSKGSFMQRRSSDSDSDSDSNSDSGENNRTEVFPKKKPNFTAVNPRSHNRRTTKKSTFFIRSKVNIY